jgi:hypothetical protein
VGRFVFFATSWPPFILAKKFSHYRVLRSGIYGCRSVAELGLARLRDKGGAK